MDAGYEYVFKDAIVPTKEDLVIDYGKFSFVIDKISQSYLDGMRLDYVYEGLNEYFKFINPNEESSVDVESVYNLIYEMEPTFKRCKYELLSAFVSCMENGIILLVHGLFPWIWETKVSEEIIDYENIVTKKVVNYSGLQIFLSRNSVSMRKTSNQDQWVLKVRTSS